MKTQFSTSWISSRQTRKQRKYRTNAPLHLKGKMMSVMLAKELRKQHNKRSMPIRKNDTVKVLKGEFNGKTGKVNEASRKKMKIQIEGIQKKKKDGTAVKVWFDPSNVIITSLYTEDKERMGGKKNAPEKARSAN